MDSPIVRLVVNNIDLKIFFILSSLCPVSYTHLKELSEMNEVDISEILDPLDLQTTLLVFRMLPKDTAAEVFSYISPEQKADIINAVTDKELKYILDELFFDDMIDLIEEMPANVVNKILINSTQEELSLIHI